MADQVCQVGQGEPCGGQAVGAIAAYAVSDAAWLTPDRTGGVLLLCERHWRTSPAEWTADPNLEESA